MPTYDYLCQGCGHAFEEFQSITAGALRKCPECGQLRLKRLIGPGGGIIFKGSGFYETDYRSETYKKDAARESSTSAPASGEPAAGDAKKAGPARDGGDSKQGGDKKGSSKPAKPSRSSKKRR